MSKEFEFSYISSMEQLKLRIVKVCLFVVICGALFWLVTDNSSMTINLINIGTILIATFAYVNLMQVKSELMALFSAPYHFVGKELLLIGCIAGICAFFV